MFLCHFIVCKIFQKYQKTGKVPAAKLQQGLFAYRSTKLDGKPEAECGNVKIRYILYRLRWLSLFLAFLCPLSFPLPFSFGAFGANRFFALSGGRIQDLLGHFGRNRLRRWGQNRFLCH